MVLADRKGLLPADVVHIGLQMADALAVLHNAHVLHLDLRLNHFVVADDHRVVLVDFSRARKLPSYPYVPTVPW